MPRTRSGLGQGLEALVPPLRDTSAISSFSRTAATRPTGWEVATLRRRKRRCLLTIAPADVLRPAKKRRLKASTLLALGALGAAGWELTALSGKTFYLKRQLPAAVED